MTDMTMDRRLLVQEMVDMITDAQHWSHVLPSMEMEPSHRLAVQHRIEQIMETRDVDMARPAHRYARVMMRGYGVHR